MIYNLWTILNSCSNFLKLSNHTCAHTSNKKQDKGTIDRWEGRASREKNNTWFFTQWSTMQRVYKQWHVFQDSRSKSQARFIAGEEENFEASLWSSWAKVHLSCVWFARSRSCFSCLIALANKLCRSMRLTWSGSSESVLSQVVLHNF